MGGRSNWATGIKEAMLMGEHWVLNTTDGSLSTTSATNDVLCVA